MTFTRLQIGEPRLKGTPRGAPPCTDAFGSGNILGAAGNLDSFSTGALGQVSGTPPVPVPSTLPNWVWDPTSFVGVGASQNVTISAANPRSGANHIRAVYTATTEGGTPLIYPVTQIACGSSNLKVYTARVAPGDMVDFTFWYDSVAVASGGEQEKWNILMKFFTESGTNFQNSNQAHEDEGDSGGYVEANFSVMAPATSYWVLCAIGWTKYTTFDIDDAEVQVL